MPSLKLSNPFRRGADRFSLKERAANLRAIAGRVISRAGSSEDPVFAVIREHRAAYASWEPHLDAIARPVVGSPAFIAAETAGKESRVRDEEAFAALVSTRPTTLPGLIALAKYLPGAIARNGRDEPTDDGVMGLASMCDALVAITEGGLHAAAQPVIPAFSTKVEIELTALASEYAGFARVSDDASAREDDAGLPLPRALDNAIDRVRHFTNQGRENIVRHAMALPVTTLLGFGLKAQILDHDAGATWGDNEDDIDIVRCRAFLRGLIAAAGLSPIQWPEVTPGEIRGWLADPSTAPNADRAGA